MYLHRKHFLSAAVCFILLFFTTTSFAITNERQKLLSSGGADDKFGQTVSIYGDILIVGAPYESESGLYSGAAYIYYRNEGGTGNWGFVKKILPDDGSPNNRFGIAVAVNGDRVAVGANGSCYVFEKNNGGSDNWGQVKNITYYLAGDTEGFGIAVALSGSTIVIGAPYTYHGRYHAGMAFVFEKDQGGTDNWGNVAELSRPLGHTDEGDVFGVSVAISGNYIIVGAPGVQDYPAASDERGVAYKFHRNTATDPWPTNPTTDLYPLTGISFDNDAGFGGRVAIDGNTIVVGASSDNNGGFIANGSAFVFSADGGNRSFIRLLASDGANGDHFGYHVAVRGDTIVVGAPDAQSSTGSVYVYGRHHGGDNNWGQFPKITADDGESGDGLGPVTVYGATIVAGAPGNALCGAAYVFYSSGDQWVQSKKILPGGMHSGMFGLSVAISGDTAVVGFLNGDGKAVGSGVAYIFQKDPYGWGVDRWVKVKRIMADDGATGDRFGYSVAISGDIIVVGAPWTDDVGAHSGSAYFFGRNHSGTNRWGQFQKVIGSTVASYDQFGHSVSIAGNKVLIGAPYDDDKGTNAGAVYIFSSGTEIKKLTASNGSNYNYFGWSVDFSDTWFNWAVVGAPDNNIKGSDAGAVYFFEKDWGGIDQWGEHSYVFGTDTAAGDRFGSSVAIAGDTVVIGAPSKASDSGAAYVFKPWLVFWVEAKKILPEDSAYYGSFGYSVGVEGDVVAVGAPGINSSTVTNPGWAYIFKKDQGGTDNWGQQSRLAASDGDRYDLLGYSIGISGSTAIVGAPQQDGNNSNSGAAYIFSTTAMGDELAVDFDGDATTDIAVYRSSSGAWYIIPSSSVGTPYGVGWGGDPNDVPVPGDYDGDGMTDVAVYRKDTGAWYITPSKTLIPYAVGWGGDPNDVPVPGDYNGDGMTDCAVYRKDTGAWYIIPSPSGTPYAVGWGGDPNDVPVPGDYNGDGMTDVAVYRKDTGAWFIIPSSPSGTGTPYAVGWGGDPNDVPVPGDYNGDGMTDCAVYRKDTGAWFIIPSPSGTPYAVGWGGDPDDVPVPGDYNGDGMTDCAVYRKDTGAWFIIPSPSGTPYGVGWGGDPDDIPVNPTAVMFMKYM